MELDEQLCQKELIWKQKSWVERLTSSELNTKFIHAAMVIRRCHNQITNLKNRYNDWISGTSNICAELGQFYQKLYSTENLIIPLNLENLIDEGVFRRRIML